MIDESFLFLTFKDKIFGLPDSSAECLSRISDGQSAFLAFARNRSRYLNDSI